MKCKVCPKGCRCDRSGCVECVSGLREVRKIDVGEYVCECIEGTEETLEGICQCQTLWKLTNGTCVCDTSLTTLVFSDADTETCVSCPIGC